MVKAMSSLKSRVFLVCAFVAVLSIALGTRFVTARISSEAEAELSRDLQEAARLLEEHHRQRGRTLTLVASLVADLPKLKAAVATGDGPTVDPLAREYKESLSADVLVLTDQEGRILSSPGSDSPVVTGEAVARARRGEESSYFGVTPEGVLQIVTLPIVVGPEPAEVLGTLSAGFFLDVGLARELSAITRSEVTLVFHGRVVASTLPTTDPEPDEYVSVRRVLASGAGSEGFEAVLARSRSERLAFLETFREGLLLSALVGVLLAVVLSYAVARTVTRPLAVITETMKEISRTGDLTRKIELDRVSGALVDEDATVVASAFNRLTESIGRFQREGASRERLSALGRMSTVIAHEIRNPLMIIRASLRSLRRPELAADEVREAADDIDHEVVRLDRIVGGVLDFARPIVPEWKTADVNAVCRSAAAAVFVSDSCSSISLRLEDGLPALVTDPERLRTALVNILANAKEAVEEKSPERGGRVGLETLSNGEGSVSIIVRDDGVGIAAEDLPRIFEPYFTGKRTGTGLGLAITKNIVESLGGAVSARSQVSKGSEFRVELFARTS
jgi:signal transduction histidine kinase